MMLIADIGGTRARFALSDAPGNLGPVVEYPTGAAPFIETVRNAVADLGADMPTCAAFAVAGVIADNCVQLTNADWRIDAVETAGALGMDHVHLLNDFEAIAHALPLFAASHVSGLNHAPERARAPKVVLGPGTGLGLAAALPAADGGWTVATGEGGHVTLAARTGEEDAILTRLRARFQHVSAERVLSGSGLEVLHDTRNGEVLSAEQIAKGARAGWASSLTTVHVFTDFLATVAGDAALTFGAKGGVYLTGGVLAGIGPAFEHKRFLKRFADKGRFSDYLADVPVYIITHPSPALLGLSASDSR